MGLFDQYVQNIQRSSGGGGGQGSGYSGGGSSRDGSGFLYGGTPATWQQFQELRNQVQYANQQNQPYWSQNQFNYRQERPDNFADQKERSYGYRQMTDLEKFSAGARKTSDFINNAVGNFLFGTPDSPITGTGGQAGVFGKPETGADLSAIKPENVPRMIANIPGMFVGSIPDIFAYGSELAAGTPAMEGDLDTGLIENRQLTTEEKFADTGYLALSAASLIPGVGPEAKIAGVGLKAAGKAAGKSAAGKAFSEAGNAALHGTKTPLGAIERVGIHSGKTGSQLNPYRWGDAALGALGSGAFEAVQEGGQTAFEDLRYGNFDLSDPNATLKRVKEGAFWGGLAGSVVGGAPHAAGTALTNSRANRGLDRDGNKIPKYEPFSKNNDFYKFWDNDADQSGYRITPEMQQLLLEQEGDRRSLQHVGSSMKGVAGAYGQNPNVIMYGTRGLRRQFQRIADDSAELANLSGTFGMKPEDFAALMQKSDQEIVAALNPIIAEKFNSKNKADRMVLSNTRAPATKPGSHQTFFVGGLTAGNTVMFNAGIPTVFGGDLDGDTYSIYQDKDMASWEHLPTRKLMGPKAMPAANSNGMQNIPYGSVEYGFEEAGITKSLANKSVNGSFVSALDSVIDAHGIHGDDLVAMRRSILSSFDVDSAESSRGITWKHKLAKTLSDIVTAQNGRKRVNPQTNRQYTVHLAGDDLVSDILTVMSVEGSVLTDLDHAVDALDPMSPNFMPELEATYDNIPTQKGAMPEGKVNLMQTLVWFGKLNSELSTKDSPMFRFKQMTAWNAKYRQMSQDFLKNMGIDNRLGSDKVEQHVKWCMQMINTMHLPIDYAETAFKVKVMSEVESALGIDGSSTSAAFGNGLDFDTVKQVFTEVWDRNAALFDKAAQGQFTSKGYESVDALFHKNTIKKEGRSSSDEDLAFARNYMEVFGTWDFTQIAKIDRTSFATELTLAGAVESIASNPLLFDTSQFDYVGGDFGKLFKLAVGDYQGKQSAQISSVVKSIDTVKDMKAEITVDEDGRVSWDDDHDLEMGFWAGFIQNILGLKASAYLGIWGVDHLKHSNWGRYFFNKNPQVVKRVLVAAGIRYNWREYIDAVSDPRCNDLHVKAALSRIDMSNPLNRWIVARMYAAGEIESGERGVLSNTPLMELVDPEVGSYDRISELFDHSDITHNRPNSDMLLFYALDDGTSVVTGSELNTRAKTGKNYINAMHNNAMARARHYVHDLKKLVDEFHQIEGVDVVRAVRALSTSHPNVINTDTYAVAIHDAGFASGRAAEKAKASRGASMHWDSVTDYLGGYSASFLKQLGVSVGNIDSESAFDVADAVRQAVFDPTYSQMVTIDAEGHMIEITQENLFRIVDPNFKAGDDIGFDTLVKLFDEAPQILCQLMPHTYEPLSPDAETVSAVMLDEPAKMVSEYISNTSGSDSAKYIAGLESKKARNRILADQDSTLLIFGALDSNYDQLVIDTAAWSRKVNEAADGFGNFIYRVACIEDETIRRSVVERNFGSVGLAIGRRTKESIDDLIEFVRDKEHAQRNSGRKRQMSNRIATSSFLGKIEGRLAGNPDVRKQYRDMQDQKGKKDLTPLAKEEAIRRRKQHDMSLALTEAYLQYEIGDKVNILDSTVDRDAIELARSVLENEVDENGNRVYSDEDVDVIIKESQNLDSVIACRKSANASIIARGELNTNAAANADVVIEKVSKFWKSREYKRLQSEYFKDDAAFDEWRSNVTKAYNWRGVDVDVNGVAVDADGWTKAKRDEWISKEVAWWNREILSANLQAMYDTYGAGTASNELSMLEDARDFVYDMIDEVASDQTISKVAPVDIDSITMPRISYSNKATAPHITAASIELESGGAPIMSGQNAGSYQYLTVLDFIEGDFSCPSELRTGLTRDEAVALAEGQVEPLNYVNADGSISTVTASNLKYAQQFWSDERIAATRFAPQRDCLCGAACHHHNPLPVTGTSGTYIGGRYTIADLCWYLSERRVFKSKKRRRVFDKISHIVNEASDLKKTEFVYTDRETLLENVKGYQERLAEHIMNVFVDEHMDDEFGIGDARIIAQFMTPALKVAYRTENGIEYDTVSKWSLASDEAFAKELTGDGTVSAIDVNGIVSVKPVAMSITDVCKKLTSDLLVKVDSDERYVDGKTPKRSDLSRYVSESMGTWRGKVVKPENMLHFIKNQPVSRKSMGRSILFGSSPNVMQNFMDFGGSMQSASSYGKSALINRAITHSMEDKATVDEFNSRIKINTSTFGGDSRPIVIVKYVGGDKVGKATPYDTATSERFTSLSLNDENFRVSHAYNAIILPSFSEQDADAGYSYWTEAEQKGRVVLVPADSYDVFISSISDKVDSRRIMQSMVDGEVTVNGYPFVMFDPFKTQNFIDNDMPQTWLCGFDPMEMLLGYQDRGMLATGDSGSKVTPRFANLRMPFDTTMEFSKDVLFGKMDELRSQRMHTIDLDDTIADGKTHRMVLREEVASRLAGNKAKSKASPFRIVMPKFDETYDIAESEVLRSIQNYLSRGDDQLQHDGTVLGEVNLNECMNIIAVRYGSELYYIPLIYNRGGGPMKLDHVYLDVQELRSGKVAMRWDGKMTAKEAEGLKIIYPTIAYKSYSTVMSDADIERMVKTGIDITIVSNGQKMALETVESYSGSTEDSRLIDAGFQTKMENLANLGKILPRHFFEEHDPATGKWTRNYKKFEGLLTPQQVDRLCEWNSKTAWIDFVYDTNMALVSDPELNAIFRKVARAALSCGMNPLFAFANMYTNGKIRYVDYNHNLVFGVLTDNELERFFHAMDERFCYDGSKEAQSRPGRPAPYVDRNGYLLCSDGKYRQGHLHFAHPTDDSSMLGVPSGRVKYGIQQILNESLIDGIRSKGDISTLIEYARAKQGDPSNYIYGGRYADDWFKEKSDRELRTMADRWSYDQLNIDKHLRRTRTPSKASFARIGKKYKEVQHNLNKPIEFTGKDGKGRADLESEYSEERRVYKDALDLFKTTFALEDGTYLTEREIHKLYKVNTASTLNNGHGTYKITVRDFADWCNDVVQRVQHGDFPFEIERSVRGRPLIGAVLSDQLDRLMMSEAFRTWGGHQNEWTRDMFVDFFFADDPDSDNVGTIPKLMKSLDFSSLDQKESVYTIIDIVGNSYGKPDMSRPIGDFGLHLNDLIENSDPIYGAISTMDEYPGLYEKRKASAERIKMLQDRERQERYRRVQTYSSETGFRGQIKSMPRGAAWNTLAAVSRMMSTLNASLGPSAVIQRYITQGQNRLYIWLDTNLAKGVISGNTDGIVINNRDAVAALGENEHVKELWVALNTMTWSGEDLVNLQNVNTWEDLHNLIEARKNNMGWIGKVQAKAFNWAAGGKVGVSWQIRNWADRLASKITEEDYPELTEVVDSHGTTRFEQMLVDNPENFMLDFLTTRDGNPYFMEANSARNWVVDREHAGQSMFGLALSKCFEKHPFGQMMFVTGFCKFPHYAYNVGGWFVNHFAPVSSVVYLIRSGLIHIANTGDGKFSNYLKTLGLERTQIYGDLREAAINDVLMMGSTAFVGMLFGLGMFEPPDDEYYDEYGGRPEEWTVLGMRLKENWWLMDILGPFAAVAATWKSIEIGKPRLDLLENWMRESLWSNPIVKANDLARTMLDPTEQYLEEYDNVVEQYGNVEGGAPNPLDMFLSDGATYALNWFGQFVTPSFLKEISQSKEFVEYERSYKKVLNEEGELVPTTYLDARIRKATKNNVVLGLLMDAFTTLTGRSSRSGYVSREMPRVEVPDQNQLDSMHYFSLYNDDGSEKSEEEKQFIAFQVLSTLSSTDDIDSLYKNGFVVPIETRIYASQMLNDMKQYETDQYNAWVQETGMDAYLLGNGDFAEGMKVSNAVKSAYYDDIKQIGKLFDKLWSDEMNRGLQKYYRLPTTYAQTASGEWYATGYARSINPLQPLLPFITAAGTENSPIFGTDNMGTMGRAGNWETPSAVVEGASAGGRNLVPIDPDKITRPKLEDFANDKNGGYSDTKAGKMYTQGSASSDNPFLTMSGITPNSSKKTTTYGNKYPKRSYGGGGGGKRGGGGGGGRGGKTYTPSTSAPGVHAPISAASLPRTGLSKVNISRTMGTDRIVKPDEQYLRPDFETKGSREAYKRSDI